ncbi:2,3-diketo-L-gulonate TRAP transporter large permease [Citrobacter koseri]|nr:2,3-diketo-L-gulonate TRAP transporter large permease [Citrobacter koseri]
MFIYRDYKWSELPKLMYRTVKTVTIVMILIGFAAAFGAIMTYMQLPMRITEAFTSISDNKYVILMCINIMLLLIGTLMDMAPLILILTPVLLPVTTALGIDPVHFGMIMLVNLGIGLITPPVGSVLFVASAVSKQKIEQVVKAMLPFYAVLFLVLMLVTYIPAILAVPAETIWGDVINARWRWRLPGLQTALPVGRIRRSCHPAQTYF